MEGRSHAGCTTERGAGIGLLVQDPVINAPRRVDARSKLLQRTGMKKLSFVFVAALSIAAFGCKKKGGDCAKALDNSMELSKADMAKMPGWDDKMMQKMKD